MGWVTAASVIAANYDTSTHCAQALCCVSCILNTLLLEFSSTNGLGIMVPILQIRECGLVTDWDLSEARASTLQILGPVGTGLKSLLYHFTHSVTLRKLRCLPEPQFLYFAKWNSYPYLTEDCYKIMCGDCSVLGGLGMREIASKQPYPWAG